MVPVLGHQAEVVDLFIYTDRCVGSDDLETNFQADLLRNAGTLT